MKSEQRQLIRRLALSDEQSLADVMSGRVPGAAGLLDARTRSLVRVAGLVALDAKDSLLSAAIETAFGSGAIDEEIVEAVIAVAPTVGSSRISSMAPRVARALDRD